MDLSTEQKNSAENNWDVTFCRWQRCFAPTVQAAITELTLAHHPGLWSRRCIESMNRAAGWQRGLLESGPAETRLWHTTRTWHEPRISSWRAWPGSRSNSHAYISARWLSAEFQLKAYKVKCWQSGNITMWTVTRWHPLILMLALLLSIGSTRFLPSNSQRQGC